MVLNKQFVFIVGSPRSGTSWLQLMLAAHPSVCTTIELTLYSSYIRRWIKVFRQEAADIDEGKWHLGLPFLWAEDELLEFLREFLERVYGRVLASKPQATHILDKHPGYSASVEEINLLLPSARFVHVIRDGRDVAVSMVAAKQQIGFGTGTVRESAAAWKQHVHDARKASQYRDRYLEVRYEELSRATQPTLQSVFDFCGLPASPEMVAGIVNNYEFEKMKVSRVAPAAGILAPIGHYRKGRVGKWREELSPVQQYLFNEIAGDVLQDLGYADGAWWAQSRKQQVLVPLLAAMSSRSGFRHALRQSIKGFLGPALTAHLRALRSSNRWPIALKTDTM